MWQVTTCLGGIYQFTHKCAGREDAITCAKRVSKETLEPVDVWHDNKCIDMFKNGKRY